MTYEILITNQIPKYPNIDSAKKPKKKITNFDVEITRDTKRERKWKNFCVNR
mgnify:CR=1 FL=1